VTVTAIHRYPVKSMLGESLPRCRVHGGGLAGDRAYALVDEETGTVASAKVPKRWADLLAFSARFLAEPQPGATPPPVEITFPDGSVRRSDEADIDDALSAAVGRRVRLSATPPAEGAFEELWPEIEGLAPQQFIDSTETRREDSGEAISRIDLPASGFFDFAALHVLTEATLDRLRELAPHATFDLRRLRPNLVLAGGSGFAENGWPGREMRIGDGMRITVTMSTMRCVMTTLPQGGLPRDAETLRTIARHNRVEIPGLGTWACAGVYADVAAGGEVRIGDSYDIGPAARRPRC
jgi:uncharacterized protein YcbX